jgi:translation initiation factor IF-2
LIGVSPVRFLKRIDMTETEENIKKTSLSLARPGKLELKKTVESGQVRQSFSHGRSKMVAVEVRKKRTYAPDAGGRMTEIRKKAEAEQRAAAEAAAAAEAPGVRPGALRGLTTEEKAARARALEDAHRAEEERRLNPPVEEPQEEPILEDEAEPETAETPITEDETPAEAAPEEDLSVEETPAGETEQAPEAPAEPDQKVKPAEAPAERKPAAKGKAAPAKPQVRAEEESEADQKRRAKRGGRGTDAKRATPAPRRGADATRRRAGKLTISEALDGDDERTRSLASVRRAREKEKQKQRRLFAQEAQKIIHEVVLPDTITVQELANRMAERGRDVIRALMKMGVMANMDQNIDPDTAELVAAEFGHTVKRVSDADVEIGLGGEEEDGEANLVARPPVVTVMGHVDHGKTSLLDALRETDVAGGEAGGITQHIGAYQVTLPQGDKITFVDTPGHAAFTEMRARGAKVTDIVVLVVAADDGIMPQTVEAIHHAKAAEVPIIIAINKMDKPGADALRVRNELLQHELVVEELGGDILTVEVSAKMRTNLDKLAELILLQAEILDLKANPRRSAEGVIVESKVERGRGSTATVLVQRGTLHVGEIFIAGGEWGRVRSLTNYRGKAMASAGPGVPVEITGLNGTPAAGDDMVVVDSESRARQVTDFRQRKARDTKVAASSRGTLEQMFTRISEGEAKELTVVVKGDVHGSVEAMLGAMEKMSTDEVRVNVLHSGVGGVNESDVTLARASGALIIGFNVRANPQARDMARRDDVEIRYYSIIYDVTDDLRKALSGMLEPTLRENLLGYAEIREVFNITKVGKVGGCMVTEGMVRRGAKVRLLRDNVVIHEGSLSQLKRFKEDAKEVKEGYDCGMAFANYQDIQVKDFIECFEIESVAREL